MKPAILSPRAWAGVLLAVVLMAVVVPVLNLAERYPNTQFTVIDGLVPPLFPNVQSILFKDNEGAFLVGLIAGRTAKTGQLGFIGGLDSPLIRNFAAGYTQGVHYANPTAKVAVSMIGTTAEAWNNPTKAHELAVEQYGDGAEVILAAAGGSSLGVLKAASESGKLAIGIAPGTLKAHHDNTNTQVKTVVRAALTVTCLGCGTYCLGLDLPSFGLLGIPIASTVFFGLALYGILRLW